MDSKKPQVVTNAKSESQSLGQILFVKLQQFDKGKIAIIDGENEITYKELFDLTVRLAKALKKLGIQKGDVITIVAQNSWKLLITYIACLYIGAQINPLNHDYTPGELKKLLSVSNPALIFCTTKTFKKLCELKNELFFPRHLVLFEDLNLGFCKNFSALLALGNDQEDFSPAFDLNPKEDICFILTSSGTTGHPKLVLLTFHNVVAGMTALEELGLSTSESTVTFLPFFHVWGGGTALCCIFHGTKLIILDQFLPDKFLQIIEQYKVTKLFLVPSVVQFLAKHPVVEKYDLSSVVDMFCAAANISKDVEEMVAKRVNILGIRQCYGVTENTGPVTIIPKGIIKQGSIGKAVFGTEIKICDPESDRILDFNQPGELRVRGEAVMKAYLGNEEETKNSFDEEGFLKTGDLGFCDEEGFFYIIGRLKEIIKYKGFQVSPDELEDILLKHPSVKEAGVVGKRDERAGEVPIAFVVKEPNAQVTEQDLVQFVNEKVSVQKRLYGGVIFLETIPKNLSGKILRRKLKELLL